MIATMTELATDSRTGRRSERPVLVVAMEGWIDAGLAAATASATFSAPCRNELVATFDADELIDYRARRPTLRIVNGVDTELRWSAIRLHAATNRTGRTVLMLTGPEPDMRWHHFIAEVVRLASRLGVETGGRAGRVPGAGTPHPVGPAGRHVHRRELAARVGYLPASIEVPSGVQGALEVAFGEAGIPAVGLWARVPHYVSAMPYPAASAALLDGLARMADLEMDTSTLHSAAATDPPADRPADRRQRRARRPRAPAGGPARPRAGLGGGRFRRPAVRATSWRPSWSGSCAASTEPARGGPAARPPDARRHACRRRHQQRPDGGAGQAQKAEDAGYDAVWSAETGHDPFLPLAHRRRAHRRLELGTGIAVAFARSPMTMANIGWDLNAYSRRPVLLGLGSQIKPHIEKRYSMPWSHPAPRCGSSSPPCGRSGTAGRTAPSSTSGATSTPTRR